MLITLNFNWMQWELFQCISGSSREIIMQNSLIGSVALASQRNLNAIKIQQNVGI